MLVVLGGLAVIVVAAVGLYQWLGKPAVTVAPQQAEAPAAVAGDAGKVRDNDFVIGDPGAPVTLIEYASLTCPHCAEFHNSVLPKLKKDYVETGKLRVVYRDFPLNAGALRASALARCAGRDRFFGFLDLLFERQAQWAFGPSPMAGLTEIAALGGLTEQDLANCFQDNKLLEQIALQKKEAEEKFGVDSTPSFIINGRKHTGGPSYEDLKAAIDPLVSTGGKK
ncbi:MAG: DsbA family protein [Alphaproteobacteria bacterium]|nr:DsbA family protein [Alphaproteobacteria bacterium]